MKSKFLAFLLIGCLYSVGYTQHYTHQSAVDPTIENAVDMINGDSLLAYMQALQDFETRFMFAPNRKEIAQWIKDKFLSFGVPEVRLDSFPCYTNASGYDTTTWQYNVEAKISGITQPDSEVLLIGHYDSYVSPFHYDPMNWAPGADDNASGVAAALETARVIMQMGYQPAQSLIFLATAAEEFMGGGDSGSKHYAQQAMEANRNIRMVINNDMIAWNDGSWTITFISDPDSPHISFMAEEAVETYTNLNYIYNTWGSYADLEPFLDAGFHGIWFMENFENGLNPNYHTPDDIVDHLDIEYHTEMTKVSLACILISESITLDAALLDIMIPEANCTENLTPGIKVANLGLETIIQMDVTIQINKEDVLQTNWTGSIPSMETQLIELPEISFTALEENELHINLESINGVDDQIPINNTKSIQFLAGEGTPNELELMIRLDNNPEETSWEIHNASGELIYSGGPYSAPNTFINETFFFEENGCYQFTMLDEGGDGFLNPGYAVLYYGANNTIFMIHDFGDKFETQFDVGGTLSLKDQNSESSISLHPNPIDKMLFIQSENENQPFEYMLFNSTGILVLEGNSPNGFGQIDLANMPNDIYFITIKLDNEVVTRKLIKSSK